MKIISSVLVLRNIYMADVVAINAWTYKNPGISRYVQSKVQGLWNSYIFSISDLINT
jgi:hypothetical protein